MSVKQLFENTIEKLNTEPRFLVEARLRPLQGPRFQPTGFPDIGPALYKTPDGRLALIVESHQSMANRLEEVCWDHEEKDLKEELRGLPYVKVNDNNGNFLTSSVLEAHRLNSSYILDQKGNETFIKELKDKASVGLVGIPDISLFAQTVAEFDLFSLLHGIFISRKEYAGGRLRIPRALSAFIEAYDVEPVHYGGVKKDDVDPKGGEGKGAAEGYGHVPYHRTEFTAKEIVAYFNLDLVQMRSYFPEEPDFFKLLVALSFYKISGFLRDGLRLRTACDLAVESIEVTAPKQEGLEYLLSPESHEEWKEIVKELIPKVRKESWQVRTVTANIKK